MKRLIVPLKAISGDRIHITDKEDIAYLSVVLRMKEGGRLLVSDGEGKSWDTRVENISRGGIGLSIISALSENEDNKTKVTLYQGLPKGAKMDEIVRKATELGVFRVVPVKTDRSIPAADNAATMKYERWRRIAKEASKQSARFVVPEVSNALNLEEAVAVLSNKAYDLILVLYELEEARTLKQALRGSNAREIAVFIGPEGGFEQSEVDRLNNKGAVSVTVGDTILRTETAGPAAVAMILYELEL